MAQWSTGRLSPGMTERPELVPANVCTSDATTRPVRAVTTVLTWEAFCTSDATSSANVAPGSMTTPW